jgi:hypothetical protein
LLLPLFREEELLNIDQSETRIACGSYVSSRIGTKRAIFIKNLPRMPPNFSSFGQEVSEERLF